MSRSAANQILGRVLVVDDHTAARESVSDVLRCAGHQVRGLASAVEALPALADGVFDVVITDLQMPGMDGLEFIREIARRRIAVQAIMVTAHATIESAVEAMRHGAFDFLEKPFNALQLEQLVARALERKRLLDGDEPAANQVDASAPDKLGMVGDSRAMRDLRTRLLQVARTDETVLVCGESGAGKELVARAIHQASRRSAGPLISLNCPALSPQLAESELFGHRRGAFTGADADRAGRFEAAFGGTLMLDEITEIDLPLQAKLLRVLQERTFERVGSSETVAADVRVVACTNRDLSTEVAQGRFREDLYYRLAVVPLHLPPLRERGDDVQLLASHFLERAARRLERDAFELAADARALLSDYHWPGNVRELENIITRACVLNTGAAITAAEIRPWLQQPEALGGNGPLPHRQDETDSPLPVGARLDEVERALIIATLEHFDGHRAKAAEALGIGVRTLSGKLRMYGYAPRTRDFSQPARSGR